VGPYRFLAKESAAPEIPQGFGWEYVTVVAGLFSVSVRAIPPCLISPSRTKRGTIRIRSNTRASRRLSVSVLLTPSAGWDRDLRRVEGGRERRYREQAAAMAEELLGGDYLQADETPVGVQFQDSRGQNHQAYLWLYSRPGRSGDLRLPTLARPGRFYHFGHDLGSWYLGFSLASELTWKQVKQSIKLSRLEKSPSEKYGLTKMASDLLSWLLSKDYEKFDLHLSPGVEDNLKLGIGIDIEKIGKKNLRQLFDLLCQEITEKTEFEAKVIP
jgi:hypothetical protein